MVIGQHRPGGGWTLLELVVAMSCFAVVGAGFATLAWQSARLGREYYCRAVAMEIVDGETEALAAGEWEAFGPGEHAYRVTAEAARNLPEGRFVLTVKEGAVRLEWRPADLRSGSPVAREVKVR
jgi:hypothetical protein